MTMLWEDPPPEIPPIRRLFIDEAAALRQHQPSWAVIRVVLTAKEAKVLAANIKNGNYASFRPKGHFEAVARPPQNNNDNDNDIYWKVYARYLGPNG